MPRSEAIMDLTLNKGNSGGPIIKVGNSPDKDEVIGIADFIVNPFGKSAEQLYSALANNPNQGDISMMGISQKQTTLLYSAFIANASNGISGCISINHLLNDIKALNQ